MLDGHLNECKTCCKRRIAATNRQRWAKNGRLRGGVTPEFVEMMKHQIREENEAKKEDFLTISTV